MNIGEEVNVSAGLKERMTEELQTAGEQGIKRGKKGMAKLKEHEISKTESEKIEAELRGRTPKPGQAIQIAGEKREREDAPAKKSKKRRKVHD